MVLTVIAVIVISWFIFVASLSVFRDEIKRPKSRRVYAAGFPICLTFSSLLALAVTVFRHFYREQSSFEIFGSYVISIIFLSIGIVLTIKIFQKDPNEFLPKPQ